ncbi:MAG: GrpB family protein [Gemmatimonadaceae bacterium]
MPEPAAPHHTNRRAETHPAPTSTTTLGLESGTVRLVPHDPSWARLFEEARRLRPRARGLRAPWRAGNSRTEFFRRGEPRAHHLYLVARQGSFWRDHLAFRDALRARPAVRDVYADLELELARGLPHDREAYIEGKGAFVRGVVADALASDPG